MSDQFDRLARRPIPDSLDKASAWAGAQHRSATGASAAPSGRRGAKIAGALVAVAAVVATPLVIASLRSAGTPTVGQSTSSPATESSPTQSPSPRLQPLPILRLCL